MDLWEALTGECPRRATPELFSSTVDFIFYILLVFSAFFLLVCKPVN